MRIETLIGNILGCVSVPPPGGPQVRFSIGAGDRQALQPPVSAGLPTSNTSVAVLFEQLGQSLFANRCACYFFPSQSLNYVPFTDLIFFISDNL